MTKTVLLYIATAVAEILGCYLPYCYVKRDGSLLLLIPAALSLIAFVGLLMLHPAASGRVYAAYGGVCILTVLLWLRFIDGIKLSPQDWQDAAVVLCGAMIMIGGWRHGAD